MTKLSRTGMICLISLTLTGCSAIGNSSATIDNSRSSEGQGSTATEASPSVNEFPLGVTTSLLADGGPVLMTFDRIVATDQLHQKHAAPGTTFLILHYRTILKPSKWGAHTESLRTALFAISNSENVSYSVDDSSVLSLQMDQRFIAPDETVECMTSELHPGVEKKLVAVFQVPIDQLKLNSFLLVPDKLTTRQIPLTSVAQALDGSAAVAGQDGEPPALDHSGQSKDFVPSGSEEDASSSSGESQTQSDESSSQQPPKVPNPFFR